MCLVFVLPMFGQTIDDFLRTSDPNVRHAVQQLVSQYGKEKALEILLQQRQQQQQQQSSQSNYYQQNQSAGGRVVYAVYQKGNSYAQIKLQLGSSMGTGLKVMGYSSGYDNYTGQERWSSCVADIYKTNPMQDGNAGRDYNRKASIPMGVNGYLTVYFNL